jgi:hypothetical protein
MKKWVAFSIVYLTASCINYKSPNSYKCLSCSFYLNETGEKKYAIYYRPDKNKTKFDIVIDNVSEVFWMRCGVVVKADTSFFFIINQNGKVNKSDALSLQQTKASFYNYFPKAVDLKLDFCSSVYKFLPPRQSCE